MSEDLVAIINYCFSINDTKDLFLYQVLKIPYNK